MVLFFPPMSLFGHWKCAFLETTSLLGKIKRTILLQSLYKKSQIQEMSKFRTPRAGKSHPALTLWRVLSHCHSVVAMVMPTATSVTVMRAAAIPYPQAHLSGWLPARPLWHFYTLLNPIQSHEVEIISCPLGKGVPEAPAHPPVLSSTPAGHTHNKVVILRNWRVSRSLSDSLGRGPKATLGHLHPYTLPPRTQKVGRAS